MGEFITAAEMKRKGLTNFITEMEVALLDDMFVIPAERVIAEACNLDLNTDGYPRHWAATFENRPEKLADYLADYKRSVIIMVNRMTVNPHGFDGQNVKGVSVQYNFKVPKEVMAIMRYWSLPKEVYRA